MLIFFPQLHSVSACESEKSIINYAKIDNFRNYLPSGRGELLILFHLPRACLLKKNELM